MSQENQAEPQGGQAAESRSGLPVSGERRSIMDLWRVFTKQRFTIIKFLLRAGNFYPSVVFN